MNRNILLIIVKLVAVLVCLALIVIGNNTVGKSNFGIMLIGLAGLLLLLYDYNRRFI